MPICYPNLNLKFVKPSNNNSKILSDAFYVLRGLAIISVAYAHSLALNDDLLQRVGEILGLFGVPIFLFCSGYWHKSEYSNILLPKLFKNIIIPWLLWGMVGFIISFSLGARGLSVKSVLMFLLGNGTWLYYIPVYLIIRLIFNYIKLNKAGLILILGFSILMNIATFAVPEFFVSLKSFVTPWQNPFNWLGYFVAGMLFSLDNTLPKFEARNSKRYIYSILAILFSTFFVLTLLSDLKINYWNPFAIPMQYLSIPIALFVSIYIQRNNLLKLLGKNSLLLYLLHIQVGIAISNKFFAFISAPDIVVFLFKPIMVLLITLSIIYLMHFILKKLKVGFLQPYLGIALK